MPTRDQQTQRKARLRPRFQLLLGWIRGRPLTAGITPYLALVLVYCGALSCKTTTTGSQTRDYLSSLGEPSAFIGSQQCAMCHNEVHSEFSESSPHADLLHPVETSLDVSCESCHGPGQAHLMAGGRGGIINPRENPESCYTCHQDKHAQFMLPHSHPVRDGHVSCSDCHEPHGGLRKTTVLAHNHSLGDGTCLECHIAQRGPHVFEHEAMREGCTLCHEPHGSLNDKMLTVRGPNLCLQCHLTDMPNDTAHIEIGAINHSGRRLSAGTCWTAGCHTAPHGSNVDPGLRF